MVASVARFGKQLVVPGRCAVLSNISTHAGLVDFFGEWMRRIRRHQEVGDFFSDSAISGSQMTSFSAATHQTTRPLCKTTSSRPQQRAADKYTVRIVVVVRVLFVCMIIIHNLTRLARHDSFVFVQGRCKSYARSLMT